MTKRQVSTLAAFLATGLAALLLRESLVLRLSSWKEQTDFASVLAFYDMPLADSVSGYLIRNMRTFTWEMSGFTAWALALAAGAAALTGRIGRTALAVLAIAVAIHGPLLSVPVADWMFGNVGADISFRALSPSAAEVASKLNPLGIDDSPAVAVAEYGMRLLLASAAVALLVGLWRRHPRPATA